MVVWDSLEEQSFFGVVLSESSAWVDWNVVAACCAAFWNGEVSINNNVKNLVGVVLVEGDPLWACTISTNSDGLIVGWAAAISSDEPVAGLVNAEVVEFLVPLFTLVSCTNIFGFLGNLDGQEGAAGTITFNNRGLAAFLVGVLVDNTAASLGILVVVSVDFVLVVGGVWVVVVVHAPVFGVPFLDSGGAWADA